MAVSPVLIVDLETVLEVMEGQNKLNHVGADGLNFGQTLIFYLKTTAVRMGLIFAAAGVFYLIEDLQKLLQKNVIVACVAYFVLLILPAGSVAASGLAVTSSFLAPDNRIFL